MPIATEPCESLRRLPSFASHGPLRSPAAARGPCLRATQRQPPRPTRESATTARSPRLPLERASPRRLAAPRSAAGWTRHTRLRRPRSRVRQARLSRTRPAAGRVDTREHLPRRDRASVSHAASRRYREPPHGTGSAATTADPRRAPTGSRRRAVRSRIAREAQAVDR